MDKRNLKKLLKSFMDDEGEKAEMVNLETEEVAIKHAEWTAKLKPGDTVNLIGHGPCVVSPERTKGNRIILFYPRKQDDGTYSVSCLICPITAIVPVN